MINIEENNMLYHKRFGELSEGDQECVLEIIEEIKDVTRHWKKLGDLAVVLMAAEAANFE